MSFGVIAAALAVGLCGVGAGIGEALIAISTMKGLLRNPELQSKLMVCMILFIALTESMAIYGLVIALQITGAFDTSVVTEYLTDPKVAAMPSIVEMINEAAMNIQDIATSNPMVFMAAALAVGLPGITVAIADGFLGRISIENISKNGELHSKFLVMTILAMALLESAAIYGFVISLQVLGPVTDQIDGVAQVVIDAVSKIR